MAATRTERLSAYWRIKQAESFGLAARAAGLTLFGHFFAASSRWPCLKTINAANTFMPFVIIRHQVANFAKWKRAVNAFAPFRQAAGEKSFHVLRCAKNPNDLNICCAWDTTARLQKFLKSPELRAAMKQACVTGKPGISLYKSKEDLSA
jgi:heme-degrading monooxygenase HmoA